MENLQAALWRASVISVGLLLSITIGVGVYRLFFHPYAKYPGPLLAKLTSGYAVYHMWIGDAHTDIWECHQKYGDVVRYGPNRILINAEAGFKAIYGHGANVHKSRGYEKVSFFRGTHATLCTLDDKRHKLLRGLLNQGFSDAHIRAVDHRLTRIAASLANALGETDDRFNTSLKSTGDGWSVPKNMSNWSDFYTFDVISQVVFGASYNLIGDSENHWIIDGVMAQLKRFGFLLQLPDLEKIGLHHILFPGARQKAIRFTKKSGQIMQERKEKGEKYSADVFSKLLSATDPETGESLSNTQLWVDSNLLIIAGSDTSSTGMAALFFYLTRDPAAYDRVTKEVRSVFTTPEEVSQGPKLNSCTYLRACIQEALRLSPAVSGALWREVLDGGLSIPENGVHVPAGYEVATGIWSLNRSEKYYPEPFRFRPERWIPEESGQEAVSLAKAAFATFSTGPRNCVGKGLALTEISLAMAAIIVQCDFRKAEAELGDVGEGKGVFKGQFQTLSAFTSLKDGPYIQFRPVGSGK
ncbi:cytochrome P450, putative [Talaromyces stipitatus ATCC 10500]|uniref:Cytochrome P450, putative n=1 Tax=Talaromyces stipitatus (strain ATCC 10500 / CBS 375.48 / QM 6759 / NRRL 1006) TaxID=441959 RepID=B8MF82_TALSN|nr:cytochrome P450, putative [Talaromyces stipitatus ATCC 10500]EED16181.1 cytochrome P450, putative [Talaromyces stipitatus ATCC 10500]